MNGNDIADAVELLADGIKALAAALRQKAPPAIAPPAEPERPQSPRQVLLTPKQLAAELNVAEQTLAKWRLSGMGPHYHKFGGLIRYDRAEVVEWSKNAAMRIQRPGKPADCNSELHRSSGRLQNDLAGPDRAS